MNRISHDSKLNASVKNSPQICTVLHNHQEVKSKHIGGGGYFLSLQAQKIGDQASIAGNSLMICTFLIDEAGQIVEVARTAEAAKIVEEEREEESWFALGLGQRGEPAWIGEKVIRDE